MTEIGHVWGAYLICMSCCFWHVCTYTHRNLRHVLPIAGPPIFYYVGREVKAYEDRHDKGEAWEPFIHVLWPVSASLGFVGLFLVILGILRRRESRRDQQIILHDMMPQGVPVEQVGVLASTVGFDATAQGNNREVDDNANSQASTEEEVTLTVSMVEEEEGGEASAPRWQT